MKGPMIACALVAAVGTAGGLWWFRSGGKTGVAGAPASETATKVVAPSAPLGDEKPVETIVTVTDDDIVRRMKAKLAGSLEDFLRELHELAKTRPALAIDLAHLLGRNEDEKMQWVKNVMQQWAEAKPQEAWQWLLQQSFQRGNELGGGELPQVVFGVMAAKDPNLLLGSVDQLLRHGNTSQSVSNHVATHFGLQALVENGKTDLAREALEKWARDPKKLDLGEAAFSTVAMAMGKEAPEKTADWLRAMPQSEDRNTAMSSLAAVWAEKNPTDALKWAESLGSTEGRDAVIGRTVSDWVEQYPTQVGNWLGEYLSRSPADANSDRLVETMINVSPTVKNNPKVALEWTELLSDPTKRLEYEGMVTLRWGRQDPGAAIAHIQQSKTLPPEQKSLLMQRIQNRDFTGISEE